jgi:hypothetical protein
LKESFHPLLVTTPFARVGIDLLQLPVTSLGSKYIIVATDYYTKWVEARALPNKTASAAAGFIYEEIICRHGAPQELLSDQGREFVNEVVDQICHLFEIRRRITTPYHPQTNGLTERFNRTLINALGKFCQQHVDCEWDEFLPSVLFAYRMMTHSTTGHIPFFLLHGYQATLPLEFSLPTFNLQETPTQSSQNWINDQINWLENNLKIIQEKTQQKILHQQSIYKEWYDIKNRTTTQRFKIGDQVLRHRFELGNTKQNKLKQQFDGPYYIHDVLPNGVYKLRLSTGEILQKTINSNHLKIYFPPLRPTPFIDLS